MTHETPPGTKWVPHADDGRTKLINADGATLYFIFPSYDNDKRIGYGLTVDNLSLYPEVADAQHAASRHMAKVAACAHKTTTSVEKKKRTLLDDIRKKVADGCDIDDLRDWVVARCGEDDPYDIADLLITASQTTSEAQSPNPAAISTLRSVVEHMTSWSYDLSVDPRSWIDDINTVIGLIDTPAEVPDTAAPLRPAEEDSADNPALTQAEWVAHLEKLRDAFAPLFPKVIFEISGNTLFCRTEYCLNLLGDSPQMETCEGYITLSSPGLNNSVRPLFRTVFPETNCDIADVTSALEAFRLVYDAVRSASDYCVGIRVRGV